MCDSKPTTKVRPKRPPKKVRIESELKRVASLRKQKEAFKAKEELIRNALKVVDTTGSNTKITFDDYFDGNLPTESVDKKNRPLFDNDDEDDNEKVFDFAEKKKPKYHIVGNDERFVMDERFMDQEDNGNEDEHVNVEDEFGEERKRQLEILENVLGKPILRKEDKHFAPKTKKQMIRYDPNENDHRKHEIVKDEEVQPVSKKKRKKVEEVVDEAPPPAVSNEVFYSVSNTLTETLKGQEEFSILKAFGSTIENKDPQVFPEAIPIEPAKFGFNFNDNPFKYDSSEDEAEKVDDGNSTKLNEKSGQSKEIDLFFYITNDPRFQDAKEFFKTNNANDYNESLKDARRSLKLIARSKIRKNERKNKRWKKITKVGKSRNNNTIRR